MRSMKTMMQTLLLLGLGGTACRVDALTPDELATLLESSTKVTLVDIRDESLFQRGHIPNAINIPERVLAAKKMPPLGYVVVYGRGLGSDRIAEAVATLDAKPGIKAEALEGGYAAWEMRQGTTTQAPGLQPEALTLISYADLQALDDDNGVVLVDLRTPPALQAGLSRQGEAEAPALTPLAEKFPGKSVVGSPFDVPGVGHAGGLSRQSDAAQKPPLLVLIDDGDGKAQAMARTLRANGMERVVVLAGGEMILERDGAPGLQRIGLGSQQVEQDNANE